MFPLCFTLLFPQLKAEVVDDAIDGHKGGDEERGEKANCARGLSEGINGVEEGVQDPCNGDQAEACCGDYLDRFGEHEQQPDKEIGEDIFQVISMGTADPFHVAIVDDEALSHRQILGVDKDLQLNDVGN